MNAPSFISILIAEDNDISRQLLTGILENKGYKVWGAIDGESAIKVIKDRDIHIALVDVNMAPTGGIEFAKYLITKGIKTPVIFITGDQSSDLLIEANALGVAQVLQKPVEPERLIQTVQRLLKRIGLNHEPIAVEAHSVNHSPEDLMKKTIEMAAENAHTGKGRPFAAVVADMDGKIIGQGANRHNSRFDPTAHAEVMAIRNAAEKLGQTDLKGYTLYCSSRPTRIGEALIESVGITKVYYALNHDDAGTPLKHTSPASFEQICKDEALKLFES